MFLLIGFPEEEIEKIRNKIENVYPISAEMKNKILEDLLKERRIEKYNQLGTQRIVIMHNIPSKKIGEIIKEIRNLVEEHIIFATTTPTSLKWELSDLIEELLEEDQYFKSK